MKALNLFSFTRVQNDYATEYMNMLAARTHKGKVKAHEFESVKQLTEALLEYQVSVELLDGFFYSYVINQIGKEFDLVKIEKDRLVLNIELKSEPVELEEIEKQLRQNQYYLGFAAPEIRLFTFIGLTGELYRLDGDELVEAEMSDLIKAMEGFEHYLTDDIEKLFEPKQFLISPFNDPDKFLNGKYFLTQQQQEIREHIIDTIISNEETCFLFGITGSAGTGKTLLLYDIARTLGWENYPCCIIHSGRLSDGHKYLNQYWKNVDLFPVRKLEDEEDSWLENYDFIFMDEAHRSSPEAVDRVVRYARSSDAVVIFSYDLEPWLSMTERQQDIPAYLGRLEDFHEWTLSKRIRTSVEIATFYKNMLDLKNIPRGNVDYSDIDVIFAKDEEEAGKLVHFYEKHLNYKYPNHEDRRPVVGQEFDNVLIVMDENFYYDVDGHMHSRDRSTSETEVHKLMYQNITRTRYKLCVLVVRDYRLFQTIAGIKYQMLDRYQYKTNLAATSMSGKRLNKLAKAVKDRGKDLNKEDRSIVSDNVDIIQEELLGVEMNRKLLRNSIRFLKRIQEDNLEQEAFAIAAGTFIEYVNSIVEIG